MKHTPPVPPPSRRLPVRVPSSALARAMQRHALVFAGEAWEGMWTAQPFTCTRGHTTVVAPRNLIRQRVPGCQQCATEDITARGHAETARAGLTWLDSPWRGTAHRYRLRCSQGHEWTCGGQVLLRGAACAACKRESGPLPGDLLPGGLERLNATARERRGKCLSVSYMGMVRAYRFECGAGHIFERSGSAVLQRGAWCPKCPRPRKLLADGLERLQAAAKARGGMCLSPRFLGTAVRHRFKCARGHSWTALAGTVLYTSSWCRRCHHDALLAADGLARLQQAAHAREGSCVSKRYAGYHGRHRFLCAHGHRWVTSAQSVFRGAWCPTCAEAHAGKSLLLSDGLARLKSHAEALGGVCLDETFIGTARTYRFRCAKGHEWSGKGSAVLAGRWCKRCAVDSQRCSIEEAQAVARERGGACLSQSYVNARTHLTWRCHRGHVWNANFDNVRNKGRWCPDCKVLNMVTNAKSRSRARRLA
ncbi:hypothetical protein SAMN05216550_1459 [Paraburkholderia tropica]|uniref:Zinc-ribbon domain-containing protein n=1 Tax=Paraburkholderia tropica TaxID=92647 RepID=A0AAQ1JYS7_9BURK|nr:hypothetical protein SAMN05216550_1459 [Paraburkholderia tropica]